MADAPLPIHQVIPLVIADIEPVPELGFNQHDKYNFQRWEDVLRNVRSAMLKHGVWCKPITTRFDYELIPRGENRFATSIRLMVTYRFTGPAGDYTDVEVPAEGKDVSDKATRKAMTAAYKVALLQTFQIVTHDDEDADASSPRFEPGDATPVGQSSPSAPVTSPACPKCGKTPMKHFDVAPGERKPEWKCRDAKWDPVLKVASGCTGVIWPPDESDYDSDGY